MRILENCTSAWPMPEMQTQIDALREAFSADTSRPFELKRSFPFGSPSSLQASYALQPSPPLDSVLNNPMLAHHESHGQITQTPQYHPQQPMTPPVSAGLDASNDRKLPPASRPMMSNGLPQNMPLQTTSLGNEQVEWNPTPIFAYVIMALTGEQ
jgi:hypothetical protein